jgi:hypothetical protein
MNDRAELDTFAERCAKAWVQPKHPGSQSSATAVVRAAVKARTDRSISFCVVAQSQTLIRMTVLLRQDEPPHQHSPEA